MSIIKRFIPILVFVVCAAGYAPAASSSWNVDADGNWVDAGNWVGGTVPGSSSDTATFGYPLTADRAITVDAGRTVGILSLGNPSTCGYTLSGNTLQLTSPDWSSSCTIQTLAANGAHTDTVSSVQINVNDSARYDPQAHGGFFTASATSSNSILRIGAVTAGLYNGTTLTLNGANTSANAITGVIGGGFGDQISIIKEGSGSWTLAGANTYGQGTTVRGGLIVVGNNTAFGSGGVTFSGGNLAACSSCTLANPMNLASNVTIDTAGYNLGLSGALTNSGSLTKIGGGTLTLSATNTYSGPTTIADGTMILSVSNTLQNSTLTMSGGGNLVLNSAGGTNWFLGGLAASGSGAGYDIALTNTAGNAVALTVGGNNSNTTYSGVMSGAGAQLIKVGAGTTAIANGSYTGPTTVNQGTLSAGNISSDPINVAGGATFKTASQSTKTWVIAGTLYFYATTDRFWNSVTLNNGTVTGTSVGDWGDFLANNSTITANGASNSISSLVLGMSGNLTLNTPLITDALSVASKLGGNYNSGSLIKTGLGSLTLSGTSDYTGFTSISGTLTISDSGRLGSGTYAAAITNNGTLLYSSIATQTFSGVMSGTGTLIKAGAGKLILAATNTYTGYTIISNGVLSLSDTNCFSTNTSVYIYTGATNELNFTGTNKVKYLYVNDLNKDVGVYNSANLPGYISGSGYLEVLAIPAEKEGSLFRYY